MRCKSGYIVILKCIDCGAEGKNNVLVCTCLIKIEEAVGEFHQVYSKFKILCSGLIRRGC